MSLMLPATVRATRAERAVAMVLFLECDCWGDSAGVEGCDGQNVAVQSDDLERRDRGDVVAKALQDALRRRSIAGFEGR